jgi:hypothetical protein
MTGDYASDVEVVMRKIFDHQKSHQGNCITLLAMNATDLSILAWAQASSQVEAGGFFRKPEVVTDRISGGHAILGIDLLADPDIEPGTMWIDGDLVRL